jgi:hypothetical protein
MLRVAGLEITVREAGSGAPIEEFGVALLSKDTRRGLSGAKAWGRHAGGVLVVADETPGQYLLRVLPSDRVRWRPGRLVPVVIQGGAPTRVTVELLESVTLAVSLRFTSQAPVPGSRVQLIRNGVLPDRRIDQMDEVGREGETFTATSAGYLEPTVVLDEAISDARGEVTLRAGLQDTDLVLRALGPGHVPIVQRGVTIARDGTPVRLVVTRGATLTARLTPVSVLVALDYMKAQRERFAERNPDAARRTHTRRRPGLTLRRVGETDPDRWLPNDSEAFPADTQGRVHADGLAPGAYELLLRWFSGGMKQQSKQPLAVITLTEDQTHELELDIGALLPGSLSAHVLLDGAPLPGAQVELLPSARKLTTDADGRITVPVLDAGRYGLRVRKGDGRTAPVAWLLADESVDVVPGTPTEFVFHARSRVLRLQVRRGDGTPAARARLAVSGSEPGFARLLDTDASGDAVVADVPFGRFVVRLVPADAVETVQEARFGFTGRVDLLPLLGTVEVLIEQTEARATLRLP